ncbi:MAG TPA: hypothetical protein VK668_19905 [Mucilaginibacter sp.]|nr:hypothetical protein [Mucilaginibacter sp.]
MRNLTTLTAVLLVIVTLFSCTKKAAVTPPENKKPIEGKWQIKRDTVTLASGGVNFVGTSSDYFDFRTSNRLYIKEGAKLDTFAYNLTSDNVMFIGAVGAELYGNYTYKGNIQTVTAGSATIQITPITANPDTYLLRIVNLQR